MDWVWIIYARPCNRCFACSYILTFTTTHKQGNPLTGLEIKKVVVQKRGKITISD